MAHHNLQKPYRGHTAKKHSVGLQHYRCPWVALFSRLGTMPLSSVPLPSPESGWTVRALAYTCSFTCGPFDFEGGRSGPSLSAKDSINAITTESVVHRMELTQY
eukprot:4303406-Amphidinium_carterae.1